MTKKFFPALLLATYATISTSAAKAENSPVPFPRGWITESEVEYLRNATGQINANCQRLLQIANELNVHSQNLKNQTDSAAMALALAMTKIMSVANLQQTQVFFIGGYFLVEQDKKPTYTKIFAGHATAVNAEILKSSEWLNDVVQSVSPKAIALVKEASKVMIDSVSQYNNSISIVEAKNIELEN